MVNRPLASSSEQKSSLSSKGFWRLLIDAGKAWNADNAFKHSAAVSFYTLFSMAPITIIVLAIAGLFFGKEAANGQLTAQLTQLVGKQGAEVVQQAVAASQTESSGWLSTILAGIVLLLGATTVFGQLQDSLNEIWGVTAKPSRSGLIVMLVQRVVSFAMVLSVGFVLLVSLLLTTSLTSLVNHIGGDASKTLLRIVDFAGGLVVVTILFALVFKILPDVKLQWKDAWIGALVTSVLFSIGRVLISIYLGHSTVASTYGAAGSLVALLVWIYYSSAILFYGAEFTRVSTTQGGREVEPKKTAVQVRREIMP